MNSINAKTALDRLREGNARYTNNLISLNSISHGEKRSSLVEAQNPFAIILSCSDSRVPSEIVFDQGLGDLFVIRVAGNIVAPSIIGSIEFAASTFGTQLVVVMGHTHCGAVSAALNTQLSGHKVPSENIRDIVDRISPALRLVFQKNQAGPNLTKEKLLEKCIRENVEASIRNLKDGSQIIRSLIAEAKLKVVGAEYNLSTGSVLFFDTEIENKSLAHNKLTINPF